MNLDSFYECWMARLDESPTEEAVVSAAEALWQSHPERSKQRRPLVFPSGVDIDLDAKDVRILRALVSNYVQIQMFIAFGEITPDVVKSTQRDEWVSCEWPWSETLFNSAAVGSKWFEIKRLQEDTLFSVLNSVLHPFVHDLMDVWKSDENRFKELLDCFVVLNQRVALDRQQSNQRTGVDRPLPAGLLHDALLGSFADALEMTAVHASMQVADFMTQPERLRSEYVSSFGTEGDAYVAWCTANAEFFRISTASPFSATKAFLDLGAERWRSMTVGADGSNEVLTPLRWSTDFIASHYPSRGLCPTRAPLGHGKTTSNLLAWTVLLPLLARHLERVAEVDPLTS